MHVRRHLAASPLFKGIPNFRETRIAMLRSETVADLTRILDDIAGRFCPPQAAVPDLLNFVEP